MNHRLFVGLGSLAQRLLLSAAIAIPASYGVSGNWSICIIVLSSLIGVHTGRGHAEDYERMSKATIEENLAQGFVVGTAELMGVCAISLSGALLQSIIPNAGSFVSASEQYVTWGFLIGIGLSFRYLSQFNVRLFALEGVSGFTSWLKAIRLYLVLFLLLALAAYITSPKASPIDPVNAIETYLLMPVGTLLALMIFMGTGAFVGKVAGSLFTPAMIALMAAWPYIRIMLRSVFGLFVGYTTIFLWFWGIYLLLFRFDPNSWSNIHSNADLGTSMLTPAGNLLYFSATTVSTLGYSEVRPASPVTQTFASLEAIIGIAWWVIVFAAMSVYLAPLFSSMSRQRDNGAGHKDTELLATLVHEHRAIREDLDDLRQRMDSVARRRRWPWSRS